MDGVAMTTQVKTWDFSWSRSDRTFRLRADGEEILADRRYGFQGLVYIDSADGKTGHMKITASVDRLTSGEMIFYLPDEFTVADSNGEPMEHADLWQLCFNRKGDNWRIWDKARRNETLQFVDGYQGPAYIDWHDGGGHIYVHGRMAIHGNIAQFAGDKP